MKNKTVEDYIFHKQTYKELAATHGVGRKQRQKIIDDVHIAPKTHYPRPVHLLVDATYRCFLRL
ncbi:hypothetical protein EBT25_06475 [bacterium]|nr:hypothetical protein [bacterium]